MGSSFYLTPCSARQRRVAKKKSHYIYRGVSVFWIALIIAIITIHRMKLFRVLYLRIIITSKYCQIIIQEWIA